MNDRRRSRRRDWPKTCAASLFAAGLVLLAACAARGGGPEAETETEAEPRGGYDSDPVTLRVDNRSWDLVRVHVVSAGARRRLGQVSSQQSRDYVVPSAILRGRPAELRLIAVPPGAGGAYSRRVLVVPGNRVVWTLELETSVSSVEVR